MQSTDLRSDRGEFFSFCPADEHCIGRGAMGTVYKGWYSYDPERKVAIKMVHERAAQNRDIRRRARHEASLAINHPNIIRMLGYCQYHPDNGPIFIVSEFVRGTTINHYANMLPYDGRVETVSNMICSVLDALTCLHSINPPIWHRDIKPSNIMVDASGCVKLMDLGIATTDGMSLGTIEGQGFGTYAYAPPEQVLGDRAQVNGTSDTYSLGVTFYELLTGINPFATGSDVDILDRQLTMVLPYHEAIPKSLFKVILKATEKNQGDRYQSAQEFKDSIIASFSNKSSNDNTLIWVIVGVTAAVFIIILILILLI